MKLSLKKFINNLTEYEAFIEVTYEEKKSINSSAKVRFKHVGEFGIVMAKQYCGLGLDNKMH